MIIGVFREEVPLQETKIANKMRTSIFLIAIAIQKYFSEVRLFAIFIPFGLSEFHIYFLIFTRIIIIVLHKY